MIQDSRLDFWFKHNRNVLFVGKHGVGKTSLVKACFERNGLIHRENYLYFSASTLDPWVDLVGVPFKKTLEDGTECLDLVRPSALANGKIEAIFFDEFNRSPKKVRNAVMELMQFKSINGLVFPNLKCVWAAINPDDDDTYDVEKIDPAQKDRFHVIKEIEYQPDRNFFINRFGSDCGSAAVEWWNGLPETEKDKVTPRRLEYALDEWEHGGNISDILPVSCGINKLLQTLKHGPIEQKIKSIYETQDITSAKAFLANDNNFNSAIKFIIESDELIKFFISYMPKERLAALMAEYDVICRHVCKESKNNKDLWNMMREIVKAGQDEKLVKRLRRHVANTDDLLLKDSTPESPTQSFFMKGVKASSYYDFTNCTMNNNDESEKYFTLLKSKIAEDINKDDARNIIDGICNITRFLWSHHLCSPVYKELVGIINHCLKRIATEQENVLECLLAESKDFSNLCVKLAQIGQFNKVERI